MTIHYKYEKRNIKHSWNLFNNDKINLFILLFLELASIAYVIILFFYFLLT